MVCFLSVSCEFRKVTVFAALPIDATAPSLVGTFANRKKRPESMDYFLATC